MKRKKGFYSISVVAKMFSVHQQTIRMYEKEGLIAPKRSEGNTRLFSEEDVDRLEEIIYLTHKMGVNLAGVEMILKLQKKIKKLQDEINTMFTTVQGQLEEESSLFKGDLRHRVERLAQMKREVAQESGGIVMQPLIEAGAQEGSRQSSVHNDADERVSTASSGWEIDYDSIEK